MTITKTKNETYRLRMYIPEEARASFGIASKTLEKRFKTRGDAKKFELVIRNKIDKILNGDCLSAHEIDKDILFSDFYKNVWWEAYKVGQTTSTANPPTDVTIENTEIVFRRHILPMLGNYSINFLNQNKPVILNLMTAKAEEYANFKTLRSYVNSIFDWAEELEYIEMNRISKTIRRIKSTKKLGFKKKNVKKTCIYQKKN